MPIEESAGVDFIVPLDEVAIFLKHNFRVPMMVAPTKFVMSRELNHMFFIHGRRAEYGPQRTLKASGLKTNLKLMHRSSVKWERN